MPDDVATLINRIDAEFSALDAKIKHAQGEKQQAHRDRHARLATFEKELETLPDVWKPRLEALVKRFGDRAKVAPITLRRSNVCCRKRRERQTRAVRERESECSIQQSLRV